MLPNGPKLPRGRDAENIAHRIVHKQIRANIVYYICIYFNTRNQPFTIERHYLPQIMLNKCSGCRICELACSYHHSNHKYFNPKISSLTVERNNERGTITVRVEPTCDHCINETQQLCVKYCSYGALFED